MMLAGLTDGLYIVHENIACYYVEARGWSIRRVWKNETLRHLNVR